MIIAAIDTRMCQGEMPVLHFGDIECSARHVLAVVATRNCFI